MPTTIEYIPRAQRLEALERKRQSCIQIANALMEAAGVRTLEPGSVNNSASTAVQLDEDPTDTSILRAWEYAQRRTRVYEVRPPGMVSPINSPVLCGTVTTEPYGEWARRDYHLLMPEIMDFEEAVTTLAANRGIELTTP